MNIYKIVDRINKELERRFSINNIAIMKGVSALCPKSDAYLESSLLITFGELFKADSENLQCEIATFKCLLGRKQLSECPGSIVELEAYLATLKEAFYELHTIV